MKRLIRCVLILAAALAASSQAAPYDPPPWGDTIPLLWSPPVLGGASPILASDPLAAAINPAATAANQRFGLSLAYLGLVAFGPLTGWGSALSFALSSPADYGVWNASAHLVSVPASFMDPAGLPWGTIVQAKISFAKDVYPDLWIGIGVTGTFGWAPGGTDWSLGLDAGFVRREGKVGFLEDFRWGVSIANMGRGFSPPWSIGASGDSPASAYPSPFTPTVSVAGAFIDVPSFRAGFAVDLSFPAFSNVVARTSLEASIARTFGLRVGMSFDLASLLASGWYGFVPAVSAWGRIPLGPLGDGDEGTELSLDASTAPLGSAFRAVALEATLLFGVIDTNPPRVTVAASPDRPIAISPNGDGKADSLALPVKMEDERFVDSWSAELRDAEGNLVRRFGAESGRPTSEVFFFDALLYRKRGVVPPETIAWDGRDSSGAMVPDGAYALLVRAADDSGNAASAGPFVVVVDTVAPTATFAPSAGAVFSPDGDGLKDSLAFAISASKEEQWTLEILDADGAPVRVATFAGVPPAAWAWDGRTDAKAPAPDGTYSARLRSEDAARNSVVAVVEDLVLDTSKPVASLDADRAAFSPNGDGLADALELSVKLGSRERIASWSIVVTGSDGQVAREEKGGPGSAPPARWLFTGKRDDGGVMPEGRYQAALSVTWENGWAISIVSMPFALDVTPPRATFAAGDPSMLFSPDGDGLKDSFPLRASGSVETLWTLEIADSEGRVVRTVEFESAAPSDWAWDGRGDSGKPAPDGVYRATLSCVDEAMNSIRLRVDNIIANTARPVASLRIDHDAFSPNGDGSRDSIVLSPTVSSKVATLSWNVTVFSAAGQAVWKVEGGRGTMPPETLPFAGVSSEGAPLPEGRYYATLSLEYANGFAHSTSSPPFSIDLTPPSATVTADRAAFNPAGGSGSNVAIFAQKGSVEDSWRGEVADRMGRAVRTFVFEGAPRDTVAWDGRDDSGRLVPDGEYSYRLRCVDRAGNSFATPPVAVAVDTEKKPVLLSADRRAFSPNGDGVMDTVTFIPQVAANDRVETWELVLGDAVAAVKSLKGTGAVPRQFVWDGKTDSGARAPDAEYRARLVVRYRNGDAQEALVTGLLLDTTPPRIEISSPATWFNPVSGRKEVTIFQKADPGDEWKGAVLDDKGRVVRTWSWKGSVADARWNGTDDAGNLVPDGRYSYSVSSVDAAGNRAEKTLTGIVKDTRDASVFLTASANGFSPNGDGKFDDVRFGISVTLKDGMDSWRLVVTDEKGRTRRTWSGKDASTVPAQLVWDGKGDDGLALEGDMTATFTAWYARGDAPSSQVGPIALDLSAPRSSIAVTPELFSPDGDGTADELAIELAVDDRSEVGSWKLDVWEIAATESTAKGAERLFTSFSGTGRPAPRLQWDGKSSKGELVESATDYELRLTVTDRWGNVAVTTRVVTVDVLVMRDGDNYRIKVPAIVFQPMQVDFSGLAPEKVERNMLILRRIATILLRFRDYRIQIEGHAVNGAKLEGKSKAEIDREENEFTLPFSTKRAESIRQMLIGLGVEGSRMTVIGRGSSMPSVDIKDVTNRWKNRRVEFLLTRR